MLQVGSELGLLCLASSCSLLQKMGVLQLTFKSLTLGVKLLRVDKAPFWRGYERECFDMLQTCCGGYKGR